MTMASSQLCDVLRGDIYVGATSWLKLGVTRHRNAASPYELLGFQRIGKHVGPCGRPVTGDVLMGVSGAVVYNGSLEEAVMSDGEYAFPIEEDGEITSFALITVQRLRVPDAALTFAKGAGIQAVASQVHAEIQHRNPRRQEACQIESSPEQKAPAEVNDDRKRDDERKKAAEDAAKERQERAAAKLAQQQQQKEADEARKKKKLDDEAKEQEKRAAKERQQKEREAAEAKEKQKKFEEEQERKKSENKARDEELAWKANLDAWAQHRKDRDETYSFVKASFAEDKGPVGMSFSAANLGTVVSVVEKNRPAYKAGIQIGDELIELRWTAKDDDGNEMEKIVNTTQLSPSHVRLELRDAAYPRTFVFYRGILKKPPEATKTTTKQETKTTKTVLRVRTPTILQGDIIVGTASWAPEPNTTDASVVLADPVDGCAGTLTVPPREGRIYALVARGVCTFVDKVRALALKGGVDGVIIYNNEASGIAAMPKGSVRTDDVKVPVVMVSQASGLLLTRALVWPVNVVASLGPPGPALSVPERRDDLKGTVHVQCGPHETSFDHVAAAFGPLFGDTPVAAAIAVPPHLCGLAGVERRLTGMAAIVRRGGGCSFSDKALTAYKLGAALLIVVNSANATETMMVDPAIAPTIKIPAVMTSRHFGDALDDIAKDSICAPAGAILLRLTYSSAASETS